MKPSLGAALALAVVAMIALPGTVLADAEFVTSDPPDGGTIGSTPYTFVATFSQELLDGSSLVIRDERGAEVARGGVDPDNRVALSAVLPELPDGGYAARWTARSVDGHTLRGTIRFSVVAASPTDSPSPSQMPTPTPRSTPSHGPSAAPTIAPTAEPVRSPTDMPTASGSPAANPAPIPSDPGASSNDLLIALVLAGVAVGAVVGFIVWRGRIGQPG